MTMDREEIQNIIDESIHSLAIEGLKPDSECVEMCKNVLSGNMTLDDYISETLRIVGVR